MKKFGVLLAGLLVIGATSAQAQNKCGLFSVDPACRQSSGPSMQIDFGKGQKAEKPLRAPFPQGPWRPVAGGETKKAFDCHMIRSADRNLDPRIVKAPPSTVKYALRVIEAPSCQAK